MGNSVSTKGIRPAKYSREQNMKAFDRLPKKVRQALANSDHNWSAAGILYDMRRCKKNSAFVVARIAERDRELRETP